MKEIIQVEDSFEIKGRGTVFTFKAPMWLEEWCKTNSVMDSSFGFNHENNRCYCKVIGTERMGVERPLLEGDKCGWLVEADFSIFVDTDLFKPLPQNINLD